MVHYDEGRVGLGLHGDMSLVGAAIECVRVSDGTLVMRVITDADAVYGVDDPHVRTRGDHLNLTGESGAQGVVASPASEFTVVIDAPETEETLVRIDARCHQAVAPDEGLERLRGGALNAALAREVVRCHREYTGRGPTKAQAFHSGNVVVVLLSDTMTKAERNLIRHGNSAVVTEVRSALQNTMRAPLVTAIEDLTGAQVVAFMSGNHLDPDMAVEVFVLDGPVPAHPPSASDA
jgi:uncharacterized protein YbcI